MQRSHLIHTRHLSALLLLLIALLISSQSSLALARPTPQDGDPRGRESEDPANRINAALLVEGKVAEYYVKDIPREAFSQEPFERKKAEDDLPDHPVSKLHPLLEEWLGQRGGDEREILLINFRDDLQIPRFPEPATDEPRDSATNKALLERSAEIIRQIEEARAPGYRKLSEELRQYEAKLIESFWLINGVVVDMPLGAVKALVEREDVLYIEPQNTGEKPPADDVVDGRARIVSDPYFNLGLTGGWIGLLDTGVRASHTLFNSPDHIDFMRDCVNGTASNCTSGSSLNPDDDCWDHGTSSAAIITGNNALGNAYRGVTGVTLDSFKVYPSGCGGLNAAAAVRGFQAAVAVLDRVIVAEMQGGGSHTSSISVAADNAFDAGAVVIAANGNNGPAASTVNVPANAHKALGVGALDVETLAQQNYQSRGPTADNRYKPDIQAPTNTDTASSSSNTAINGFGGTSGATPYAAGAATLLRNWLRGTSFSIDPGQVYAQMILSGQQAYPFNNTSGAGLLNLPTNGWAWWGKVTVTNGATIDIPLNVSASSPENFDGALWWPESAAQAHNDIDLRLVDPSGVERDFSISIPSVFERAEVVGAVPSGTWKLRIRGYSVPTGSQTVYWAAHVQN